MADETVLTDKGQILAQMSERRQALLSALDEAGPELIERPGTWNNWTLKDLMAHIIYWQTVAIDRLQKTIAGRRDEIEPAGDEDAIDRINEKVYRANKDRPLAEMRDLFHTTYLSLRTAVKSIPAGLFAECGEGQSKNDDAIRRDHQPDQTADPAVWHRRGNCQRRHDHRSRRWHRPRQRAGRGAQR